MQVSLSKSFLWGFNIFYLVLMFLFVFLFNAGNHDIAYQVSFFGVLLTAFIFLFIVLKCRAIPFFIIGGVEGFLLLLIFSSFLISFIINIDGVNSKSHLFLLFFLIAAYSISSFILRNEVRVRNVEVSFVCVMFLAFLFGLFLLFKWEVSFFGVYLKQEYALRSNSFFSLSTTYGIYACFAILVSLKLYRTGKSKIYILLCSLFIVAVFSTGSRTGISAFFLCLIYGFLLSIIRGVCQRKNSFLKGVIVLFSFLLLSVIVFNNLSDDFISNNILLDRFVNGDTNSLGGRTEKIERGINVFLGSPATNQFFGVGTDGYAHILATKYGISPHSGFIRIFNDFGLFFVFSFLGFITFFCLKHALIYMRKGNAEHLILQCMFLYILVCETMVNSLFVLSFETILLIFLIVSIANFSQCYVRCGESKTLT